MENKTSKENIWNVPNALTCLRVVIAVLTAILVFSGFSVFYIIGAFLLGMVTDVLDGQIARRFKLTTEFGRKFDMIADRILMGGVALAVILKMGVYGNLALMQVAALLIMMLREIVSIPFFAVRMIIGKRGIPKVRIIGKSTTVMQAITFPLILFGSVYNFGNIPLYLAIATGAVGLISASYYVRDMAKMTSSLREVDKSGNKENNGWAQ